MIESKVADAKISAEARKTVGEEPGRKGAGISAAESCHAALPTASPEQRRLKRDKYKGESRRRVQVIPARRSKGCADGIRTWKQQPRVRGPGRPALAEIVRTLAGHRSARQPRGSPLRCSALPQARTSSPAAEAF
ncbi:uncharacterized protein V6R79_021926 [Siganus canaliculatus]